ncbi:MAG: FkbM family methyltransferase [Pseudomonadota bacterium]
MTLELKRVSAKHGDFFTFPDDIYIGRSLATYGQWCESEVSLFQNILKPGDCVVEVGANIGSHTVPIARAVGDGMVFAVEMQPFVAQVLAANTIVNGLTNVQVVNAGVGATAEALRVPLIDYGIAYNYGGISMDFLKSQKTPLQQSVPCAPLDDLLTLTRLDLLKLDVEKVEYDALLGARGHIERFKPVIYLECDDPDEADPIIAFLRGLNYDCYWHRSVLWDPENHNGTKGNIFGTQRCVNLMAVQQGRKVQGFLPAPDSASHPKHFGK